MTDFNLVQPFDIDDGSLSDQTPERAFVLGVEYETCRWLCKTKFEGGWIKQIHSINLERIKCLCLYYCMTIHEQWVNDDWISIEVTRAI